HTRKKNNPMTRNIGILFVFMFAVIAFVLGIAAPSALAHDRYHRHHKDEISFDEAELFFELNNTDGDLGIHALIDGEAWQRLMIEDPKERRMLDVKVKGRLRRQGLTEFFFESAEPTFDELSPEDFFRRFPAGTYKIEGITLEGDELEGEVQLTHTMPAPPAPTVNGEPMALQCDEEEDGYDATEVSAPVTIAWPAVTLSHPDPEGGGAGVQPPIPVTIVNYEVVLEVEVETDDGEEFTSVFSIVLPPGQMSITVPEEFLALGDTFKYEVLAREESYNQTAVESCFIVLEGENGADDDEE
ncbi:MAG: hypothetical protein JSW26_21555, partial [Desulfobacterales bacterium]